jgi:hypothetical protein
LQVVLEPAASADPEKIEMLLPPLVVEKVLAACETCPTYLDRYYALQPGRPNGAKRVVIVLPAGFRSRLDSSWRQEVGSLAALVWSGTPEKAYHESELQDYEYSRTSVRYQASNSTSF